MAKTNWQNIVTTTLSSPATLCNVELLINGDNTFKSIAQAIRTARGPGDFIGILGWMLEIDFQLDPNDQNSTLLALLKEAVRKGVYVHVIIWDNIGYPNAYLQIVHKLNQELGQSSPVPSGRGNSYFKVELDNRSPGPKFNIVPLIKVKVKTFLIAAIALLGPNSAFTFWLTTVLHKIDIPQSIGSHHEKVIIVKGGEGLIGFCGGIDINKDRLVQLGWGSHQYGGKHDLHCRIEGIGAEDLLKQFNRRKVNLTPPPPTSTLIPSQAPISRTSKVNPGVSHAYTKIVHTYNLKDSMNRDIKERSMWKITKAIIQNAKTYIYIEDQYLVSIEVAKLLNAKLMDPSFQILIIFTQDPRIPSELLFPNAKRGEFYDTLTKNLNVTAKKKIHFFMTDLDKIYNKNSSYYPSDVHAKLYLIDDEIALIGSANCSSRSLTLDTETGVVVFDHDNKPIIQNFRRKLWLARTRSSLSHENDPIKALNCFSAAPRQKDTNINEYGIRGNDLDQEVFMQAQQYAKSISFLSPAMAWAISRSGAQASLLISAAKEPLWKTFVEPDNGY